MDSAWSFLNKLIVSGASVAIGSFSYFCLPWIVTGVQKVVYLLEWFSWILSHGFIVFIVVGVVVFAIICLVPQGKEQDEDKVDEHVSTMSTTVRPSRPEYSYNNNYRVTEVDDDHYYNHRNNNNSSYYMENIVPPAYEPVRVDEERYERTRTEEKRITMTRSEEEKKKKKKDKKDKVTMEYRRTESERMTKYESCMSPKSTDLGNWNLWFHTQLCTCCVCQSVGTPYQAYEERYERTGTEEKRITMTRSEEEKNKKDKVTMEYRRTESERMTKLESPKSTAALANENFFYLWLHSHSGRCPNHGHPLFWKKCGRIWGEACCLRALNLKMGDSSTFGFMHYGAQHDQNGGTPYQAIDQWQYGGPQCQAGAI